jgi:threonine dehydratase
MIPSFDVTLLGGVASYSLELFRALANLETLYVPIGLGSGICGAIAVRDALGLKTEIVGVVASAAPAYAISFTANQSIAANVTDTIADGMACRIPDAEALEIIRKGASRIVTVNDDEIKAAIRHLFSDTHNAAEGAGAAALAGLIQEGGCAAVV